MVKRFMLDDAGELIDMSNNKFIGYGEEVCELLNLLNDENEKLKQQLADEFNQSNSVTIVQKNIINDLKKENQELKENCKNYTWYRQYKIILNENEELQTELEELKEILKQYETIIQKNWFKIHKKEE